MSTRLRDRVFVACVLLIEVAFLAWAYLTRITVEVALLSAAGIAGTGLALVLALRSRGQRSGSSSQREHVVAQESRALWVGAVLTLLVIAVAIFGPRIVYQSAVGTIMYVVLFVSLLLTGLATLSSGLSKVIKRLTS
jgi:cobalamin synthase